MSILFKALNQAAAEREAARRAQPPAAEAAREQIEAPVAAREEPHAAGGSASSPPMPAYGGLWITLALAVISAAGFGYWMRGMSPVRPVPTPPETVQAPPPPATMAASGAIPSALQIQEAGPMQLRLDRHLDPPATRIR